MDRLDWPGLITVAWITDRDALKGGLRQARDVGGPRGPSGALPAVTLEANVIDLGLVGYESARVSTAAKGWTWFALLWGLLGVVAGYVLNTEVTLDVTQATGLVVIAIAYYVIARRAVADVGRGAPAAPTAGLSSVRRSIVAMVLLLVVTEVNSLMDGPLWGVYSVAGHWDQYVPTIPVFTIPYVGMYAAVVFTGAFLATRLVNRQLLTFLLSSTLATAIACVTFFLFETAVPTNAIDATDYSQPFGGLLRYVNTVLMEVPDNFNDLPSMHCGFATIIAIVWWRRRNPAWRAIAVAFAVLVVIATQVLHEHTLIGGFYGIIVGVTSFAVIWFAAEYRPAVRRALASARAESPARLAPDPQSPA